MTASLLLSLLLAGSPLVATDSSCPSTMSIEGHLRSLLGPNAAPGKALVEDQTDRLVLRLQPDGTEGTERIIAVSGSCEERAMTAAVAIATWWPTGSAQPEAAMEQAAPEKKPSPAASVATPASERSFVTVAAAGFASLTSDDVAPGARVGVDFAWWERFSVRLGLSATGAHTMGLGTGQSGFQRVSGEFGVAWSRGHLQIEGAGIVSHLSVKGSYYETNEQSSGYSMGLSLAGRWGWSLRRTALWLEARAVLWPQSQRLFVTDASGLEPMFRDLPHAELQLGAGLSFGLF